MRTKKPKAAEPSARDKLSASFLKAFQNDFEMYGTETIEKLREKSPEKYAEIAAKLIAAIEPKADGFEQCRNKQDIGRKLLESIGFRDPDDRSIEEALEANDRFITALQQIHACAQASEGEMN